MDDSIPKPSETRGGGLSATVTEEHRGRSAVPTSGPAATLFARGSGHMSEESTPPEPPERTENSVMEGLPQAKVERIASIYRELAELQRQLSAAQQRIATEIQGRAEDAERLEAMEARVQSQERLEAMEARLQAQGQKAEQDAARVPLLENDLAGLRTELSTATAAVEALRQEVAARDAQIEELRETKKLIATHDAELAALTSERDAVKVEAEKLRRELETGRTKAKDIAGQLARLGQEMDGAGVVLAHAERPPRPQPPPVPPTRAPHTDAAKVETILEITEVSKPLASRLRTGLLIFGGALLGCAATFAVVSATNSDSSATSDKAPSISPPSALVVPEATQPKPTPPSVAEASAPTPPPSAATSAPTPPPSSATSAAPNNENASHPAAQAVTDGVLVLPDTAAGHRVYVDGSMVEVKSSRAVVACGSREVRIGSHGPARTIDVVCGGETAIPADTSDR